MSTAEKQQKQSLFPEKVNITQAKEEITNWLDNKKIPPYKREKHEDHIEALVNAVMYGHILIGENKQITQTLMFSIADEDGGDVMKELKYEPRLRIEAINLRLKTVKYDDVDGRVMAYVSALTNQSKGMIGKLDTEDYDIARAIATFFM